MQDKVLNTISEEILSLPFNYKGKIMIFKDYLVKEVLPSLDLTKDTIMLKNGILIPLIDFIEESVLYTCQNKYQGDFVEFAKDNMASPIEERIEAEEDNTLNINDNDKTYVFYEEITGPKYMVVIGLDKVVLACRDGKEDIIMNNESDKKDFLMRIKKLDNGLFSDIYNRYEAFRNFIILFKDDELFYNSLMFAVVDKYSNIDEEDNKEIEELSTFDISLIPLLDSNMLLNIVMKKCCAFYSEFTVDINTILEQNSILEKAEYVVSEYLIEIINHKFYDYVKDITESINNNLEVRINDSFIRDELENIIVKFKGELKRLFINPKTKYDTVASEVYIKIIIDAIRNELIKYEEIVNNNIRIQLNKMQVSIIESEALKKVS